MPEGHTIHRLARDHQRWFAGRRVHVTSPQGRFAAGATRLGTRGFTEAEAYGKHLFHRFEDGRNVHIHLGLFGRVIAHPSPAPEPRPTTRYRVSGDGHTIDLIGPTVCELVDAARIAAIRARLGPDPLRPDADPMQAAAALRRRRVSIAQALLDQRVIAGVGNVFRSEVLFVHRIHPLVPARELGTDRFLAIWRTLVDWLHIGVEEDRIVTVDPDEIGLPRKQLRRADCFYLYERATCRRCASPVVRIDAGGRDVHACETCQPPPAGRPGRGVARLRTAGATSIDAARSVPS